MSSSQPVFDRATSLWTIQEYDQIEEAFACPHLKVRPPMAPVLPFLRDTRAGKIFGNLARMSEGEDHRRRREIAISLIDSMTLDQVAVCTKRASELLIASSATVHEWQLGLSTYALGLAIGLDEAVLPALARHVATFTRAISPGGTPDQIAEGISAAEKLWEMLSPSSFVAESESDRDIWIANLIGLLFQAHDSMAGLLGSSLMHMQQHPEISDVRQVIRRVLRESPPIRNTRRFSSGEVKIGETKLDDVDTVVLDIEAAMVAHPEAPTLGFGSGSHQCPGQVLAFTIAASALESFPRLEMLPGVEIESHPLPNANVPNLQRYRIEESQP